MREFELVIEEAFKVGLRVDSTNPVNSQALVECKGFKCGNNGLEGYSSLLDPLPGTLDMHYIWPYPQMLFQDLYRVLVVRDSVNMEDRVYIVASDYSAATQIMAIDELTYGVGTLMELADFGEYAFMTNGVIMIYFDPTLSAWIKETSITTIPMMRTVCNFKGQAVGGCILSDWYDCDETYYVWSRIGEMDFTPTRRNEEGFRRDPYGGEVFHVRKLGGEVIGYSSKGITRMVPVSSPATTFGFDEVDNIGLINRGALNGDANIHCFVDVEYNLWKFEKGGVPKLLGYKEFIGQLTTADIIVSYDSNEKDFYISDGVKTFLLSQYGLTEVPQHPSAIWYDRDSYILPEVEDSYSPAVVIDRVDFGYNGQKTIFGIEVGKQDIDDLEVAIDWRLDSNVSFKRTGYKPFNSQSSAVNIISGNEFRVVLRGSELLSNPKLDWLKARYKMTDMRGIRGVYAPPPRGQ